MHKLLSLSTILLFTVFGMKANNPFPDDASTDLKPNYDFERAMLEKVVKGFCGILASPGDKSSSERWDRAAVQAVEDSTSAACLPYPTSNMRPVYEHPALKKTTQAAPELRSEELLTSDELKSEAQSEQSAVTRSHHHEANKPQKSWLQAIGSVGKELWNIKNEAGYPVGKIAVVGTTTVVIGLFAVTR